MGGGGWGEAAGAVHVILRLARGFGAFFNKLLERIQDRCATRQT
jgi:hypothetical protein